MSQPDPQSGTSSANTEFKFYFLYDGDQETTGVSVATTALRVSELKGLMIKALRLLDVRASRIEVWKVIYILLYPHGILKTQHFFLCGS